MLRGQASLQALLGKEQNFKRKKPGKQQGGQPSKRAKPDAAPSSKPGRVQDPGKSQCPVCQKEMPSEAVDAHLGRVPSLCCDYLGAMHACMHDPQTEQVYGHDCAAVADDCLPAAEARRHSGKPATRTVRRLDSRQRSKPAPQTPRQASPGPDDRSSPQEPAQRPLSASGKVTSPFKARAGPGGSAAPADSLEDAQLVTVSTVIVGRRFRSTEAVSAGMTLDLQHDDVNARDENAVMVLAEDSKGLLGYIPREVAAALCPLLKQQAIRLTGQVQSVGRNAAAPVPIQLQARLLLVSAG